MADPLLSPFAELCGALRGLQEQVEQLSRVHDAVDDFNLAFGAFQGAMALHASCLTYPKNAPPPPVAAPPRGRISQAKEKEPTSPETGIPLPSSSSVSPNDTSVPKNQNGTKMKANGESKQMKKKPATTMKRQAKVDSNNTRIKRRKPAPKAVKPAWTWERHIREKIPRKYQSPAELKKLENIVLYLKNRHCAISISDLVKHSGLPVIRCKEILQTLMKLDIIERKREKSGFVYSFGSSD
ncbi:DASH complex subunit Dam1 [Phytophthora infestans]|uniref:DASH complex subunit Dam1 n=1 Tax=Phytophthora infestans TaxID=4787 RepID=A0A8S9TG38_PHYIN|nr:DASH complex subunit Dam1 [Phytophthora infestans]